MKIQKILQKRRNSLLILFGSLGENPLHELTHAYLLPRTVWFKPSGSNTGLESIRHTNMALFALGALEDVGIKPFRTNTSSLDESSQTFNVALRQACGNVKLGE